MLFLVFPSACDNFLGPHSDFCLENVWLSVGCAAEGSHSPKNLHSGEIALLNTLNLE